MGKFKQIILILFIFLFSSVGYAENNEFHKILKERRSIRHFSQKEVPFEILKNCLESAICAPSAMNRQLWEFILIQDIKNREKVFQNVSWLYSDQPEKNEKPTTYVVFIVPGNEPALFVDCAFAVSNFINSAWAEGIGTCLIGSFKKNELKKFLKIPQEKEIFLIVACGYPDLRKIPQKVEYKKETIPFKENGILKVPKKNLNFLLFFEKYGKKGVD